MKENFKDLIKVESEEIMMALMMEKLVVTRMNMIRDTTNAKKKIDDQVQKAYEDGNQAGYKKGFQEGHDNCEK
jgi:hypothetical protein